MTSVSTLGQALDQAERLKTMQLQLATLHTQFTTGKKTQLFEGLGTDVIASKRARESVAKLDTYINNIDIADRRLKTMVTALNEVKAQAVAVLNAMEIQTQQGEIEIAAIGDLARNTADFLRDLLNERDGDRYLFGGSETLNPPLSDTGSMDTYILSQLNAWAVSETITTDQLITSYRSRGGSELNDTVMGYSAPLSNGTARSVYVRVEDSAEIDYTVFANTKGIRDIVAGVNVLANLDTVINEVTLEADDPATTITAPGATQQEQNDNFYQFFNDLAAMMNNALDMVDDELYALSQSQAQLAKIRESHKLDQNILKDTISSVEDVDINEVAVKLNTLQIQLEASYRVTATVSSLTLVNFLGP